MYTQLTSGAAAQLTVKRQGWITPTFTLTDGVSNHGQLSYTSLGKRHASVEVAGQAWRFEFEGPGRRNIAIYNTDGTQIGTLKRDLFSRVNLLSMGTGFTARFHRNTFFSRNSVWEADGHGVIMHIDNPFFNPAYKVAIQPNRIPQNLVPLLVFLGVHRVIVDQQRKAMMASH